MSLYLPTPAQLKAEMVAKMRERVPNFRVGPSTERVLDVIAECLSESLATAVAEHLAKVVPTERA